MYCTNCGVEVPPDAKFCPACGTPLPDEAHEPSGGTTTIAIDLDGEHHQHLEDLPQLEEGTGMLVVVRGPSAGTRFLLDRDVTTIGRHPDADLLLDDVTVSRRHAEVVRTADGTHVRDLGSLNGTYVAGHRVDEHLLHTGDEVQIGRFKLVYVGAESQ